MLKRISFALLAAGVLTSGSGQAQTLTTVAFDSGSFQVYSDAAKTIPLTAGVATVAGDGAVLRLGYYTAATTTNYFAGTFVPLAGFGTANTSFSNITIGDIPANTDGIAGTYGISLNFTPGNATTGNNLPANGQLLAIQIYNNTTFASSTAYNVVSDAAWTWKTPSTASTVPLTLDDANLQWFGGAGSAFYTSQALVPEPSTYAMALIGASVFVGVALRRRVANA